jgi:hypothetical protein
MTLNTASAGTLRVLALLAAAHDIAHEGVLMANQCALREASPVSSSSWEVPHDVEKAADPKALLKAVLGGRQDPERLFDRLGQTAGLDMLAKVPAYRRWLMELRTAMERLHFL